MESYITSPRLVETSVGKRQTLPWLLVMFVLGWISAGYSVFDVGKYSILLIYVAALPFCFWANSRTLTFFALPIISTVFSLLVAMLSRVNPMSVSSQLALQCLAIAFGAGVASLDWREHIPLLTKSLSLLAIPVVVYGGYQMVARMAGLPYAYLVVTNQQSYATGGYQRGWDKVHFSRASSVFVEPSDFGYFCLWLLALGLSTDRGAWRYLSLGLALGGMLFAQSLSAVLGAMILTGIYMVTNRISFNLIRQVLIVLILSVISILAIEPIMPEAFAKFSSRIQQAFTLDERADSGRVDHLPACWSIFKDAPVWGHGIASFNSADDNGTDVTSISYALLLMERGLVGTILFLTPWLLLSIRGRSLPLDDRYRTLVLLLMVLHLYCFATFSLAYFLPFWLAIGIAASLASNTHLPNRHLAVNWERLRQANA